MGFQDLQRLLIRTRAWAWASMGAGRSTRRAAERIAQDRSLPWKTLGRCCTLCKQVRTKRGGVIVCDVGVVRPIATS